MCVPPRLKAPSVPFHRPPHGVAFQQLTKDTRTFRVWQGGGVSVEGGSTVTFNNCNIHSNTSTVMLSLPSLSRLSLSLSVFALTPPFLSHLSSFAIVSHHVAVAALGGQAVRASAPRTVI